MKTLISVVYHGIAIFKDINRSPKNRSRTITTLEDKEI